MYDISAQGVKLKNDFLIPAAFFHKVTEAVPFKLPAADRTAQRDGVRAYGDYFPVAMAAAAVNIYFFADSEGIGPEDCSHV